MSQIVSAQAAATTSQRADRADNATRDQFHARYVEGIDALVNDAAGHGASQILADALTLARMIVAFDRPFVPGDILRRLGEHVCTMVERNYAREEATKEKEEGRAPH